RDGGVATGFRKPPKGGSRNARSVDGQDDADVIGRRPESCNDSRNWRSNIAAVVEDGEGQLELIVLLAEREPLVAKGKSLPRGFGQRQAFDPREGLWRAEAAARAADEEDPRQALMRHGSL